MCIDWFLSDEILKNSKCLNYLHLQLLLLVGLKLSVKTVAGHIWVLEVNKVIQF